MAIDKLLCWVGLRARGLVERRNQRIDLLSPAAPADHHVESTMKPACDVTVFGLDLALLLSLIALLLDQC